MAKSELIVGLDIGTTKICAVVGELTDTGEMDIIGIGTSDSTGLRKGIVINIEQTVQSVKLAVDSAEKMSGCSIRAVYVGIAGSHIKGESSRGMIAVKGGKVEQRDIDRALDAARAAPLGADREIIHLLPLCYKVDDQEDITSPLDMTAVRLEVTVHIVTAAVASAQNIVRTCNKSGLEVYGMALESLASAKAVLSEEDRDSGVAIIDIGGGTTDIAVFIKDAMVYTKELPLGGQNLTSDIAYMLRIHAKEAEELKLKYGCALQDLVDPDEDLEVVSVGGHEPTTLSRRMLAEICEARMDEILSLANNALENSGFKDKIGAGVILTGGTSLIEGCQELGEQIFNMPTRIGYPRNVSGLKDVVHSPKFATAVGLLRYGAEKENLLDVPGGQDAQDEGWFQAIALKFKKWFSAIR